MAAIDIEKTVKKLVEEVMQTEFTDGMTLKDVCAEYLILKSRDEAKTIRIKMVNNLQYLLCNECDQEIMRYQVFCPHCGQRLKYY